MRLTHYGGKKLARVLGKHKENIQEIERALKVNITIRKDGNITIKSKEKDKEEALDEYLVSKILEALALGFEVDSALFLKDEEYVLKVIDLKVYATGSRLQTVIGRIIGKQGKSKKVLQSLSHCQIAISEHNVGLIGRAENVEVASEAIEKLIRGAPHSNVFKFLERSQTYLKKQEFLLQDLKEKKKN